MYPILFKKELVPNIHLFRIAAPDIARKARAGQFVVIRLGEGGERIPLTLADWDAAEGSITLVVMGVGTTTKQLSKMNAGDAIENCAGPLGTPTEIENFGAVVMVAGGVGVAPIVPIARALRSAGNRVVSILGARNQGLVFWEDELRKVSDSLTVTTDDGSYGRKGLVTEPLKEILTSDKEVRRVFAIGPAIMMKFASLTTKPFGVKTIVSLNPIMVDGTGMCGACRVSVDGVTRFTCVDGPDFDAHKVNWDELLARQRIYPDEEKASLERWQHKCQCGGKDQ